jgi:hypothetical protein
MPKPKNKPQETAPAQREVLFPEVVTFECWGAHPITVEHAKDILGWEEESEGVKFKNKFTLLDRNKKKIRLTHNVTNRPLYMSNVESLVQEILNRRWKLNGEPIIRGRTGLVLNGQHCLVALILAEQDRTSEAEKYLWEEKWDGPVTMEKLVVCGIEETDEVVNTMDTCKPRSLADVIYRSEYFGRMDSESRKTASKMTDNAIRLLWLRTGADKNAWAPKRTHSEALDFIRRHPKLLKAISFIMRENKPDKPSEATPVQGADGKKTAGTNKPKIGQWVNPGFAAAMMYLMAHSDSSGDRNGKGQLIDYADAEGGPNEKVLDSGRWTQAEDFWTKMAKQDRAFHEVRMALSGLNDPHTGAKGPLHLHLAVLCLAWYHFKEGHKIKAEDLSLDHCFDEDPSTGEKTFKRPPSVGGIDLDLGSDLPEEEEGEEPADQEEEETAPAEETGDEEDVEEARRKSVEATKRAVEEARERQRQKAREEEGEGNKKGGRKKARPEEPTPGLTGTGQPATEKLPPAPTRRQTRADVEKAQTEKARKADAEAKAQADEEAAAEKAGSNGGGPKTPPKPKRRPVPQ